MDNNTFQVVDLRIFQIDNLYSCKIHSVIITDSNTNDFQ
jgi:hypothetical protein